MAKILFANNAATRTTKDISPTSTTIEVIEGTTNIFPLFETGTEYFMLCLINTDGTYEIVKCIGKTSNTFVVVRGQEGTKPIYFKEKALVENRLTAGSLTQLLSNANATTEVPGSVRIATDDEARQGKTLGDSPAAISPEQLKMFGVLSGTVVAFSGTFSGKNPIPRGQTTPDTSWQLCDGSNDTPDLRNRFVVCSGSQYAQGSTGGAQVSSVSGSISIGSTTLSSSQMPSHTHTTPVTHGWANASHGDITAGYAEGGAQRAMSYVGGSSSHSHYASSGSQSVNTIPPYYALAYIIKL